MFTVEIQIVLFGNKHNDFVVTFSLFPFISLVVVYWVGVTSRDKPRARGPVCHWVEGWVQPSGGSFGGSLTAIGLGTTLINEVGYVDG